ncbi:hypothetical protein ACIP4W_40550 [Streptomyces sp. NPDC088846]|uniref:hypothetical protein n=1 Tax=Streptomyces sp. NPDC088846 TaxID=3365908 RepID=UPI0037F47A23
MSTAEHLPVEEPEETTDRPRLELVAEPGRMASMWAELRPYLPTPGNLAGPMAGVGAGSLVLLSQGWTWVWGEGLQDGAMKAGGVLLVGYAAFTTLDTMLGAYAGYAIPPALIAWCLIAKRYEPSAAEIEAKAKARVAEAKAKVEDAKKKTKAKADEAKAKEKAREFARKARRGEPIKDEGQADEKVVGQVEEQADDGPVTEIEAEDVVDLIRDIAARNGHQGVHLDDLVVHPLFEGWEKRELKAALPDSWGIPVDDFKLRFGGRQRVRDGVRLRDLPPAPGEGPGDAAGEGPTRALTAVPSDPPQ